MYVTYLIIKKEQFFDCLLFLQNGVSSIVYKVCTYYYLSLGYLLPVTGFTYLFLTLWTFLILYPFYGNAVFLV